MSGRILAATRKGLFTIERGGGASPWKVTRAAFLGDNLSMVLPDRRDGYVYTAIGHGHFGCKIHRSPDGGATWDECASPEYPPLPEGQSPDLCPIRNTPIPWKLELIWGLEAGGADEPGALWCGTIPGGLFRSDDRGSSWQIVRSLWDQPERRKWFGGGMDLPGIHSICVHPNDSKKVAVGVSCGGVWMTTDGGKKWDCRAQGMWAAYMPPEAKFDPAIQDPHRIVQCAAQPDCYWAQHHNGIFRTTNGGREWSEVMDVPPSNFGFAVAVHPRDPNTAWFVPAVKDEKRYPVEGRVVVTRTRDGGRSFEVLRRGLPQEHAYDITFRHCLDVDENGDRLAFGTTTGSLWVTEDQGDSWNCASHHLPPIYCVKFA